MEKKVLVCINNCLGDGKQTVENMVCFHGGLSSMEFQNICAKTFDQNIYMGSGMRLNNETALGMLIGYSG